MNPPRPPLRLPLPEALPSRRADLAAAVATVAAGRDLVAQFDDPDARGALRDRLTASSSGTVISPRPSATAFEPGDASLSMLNTLTLKPPTGQAQGEQLEHDAYFAVERSGGSPALGFVAGLVVAHLSAYEDCLSAGVTLMDAEQWERLFAGLALVAGANVAQPPAMPQPSGWRDGYDPADRWLIGHQLFFALIQGSIFGLNVFAAASASWDAEDEPTPEMAAGLEFATVFMRASAAAMRYTSDFAPEDYDRTVRPDMAPPKVRAGFSGFQTRDHAYLVRLLAVLKPTFASLSGRIIAHKELVDAVVSAYEAHEFICARFRGDVLPSLRMAAAARGRIDRAGVEVVRELMRNRLALVDPQRGSGA